MLLFISCAKTMTERHLRVTLPFTTLPYFESEARANAMEMNQFSADDLGKLLHINTKLAAENYLRYQNFFSPDTPSLPALLAYTGMVFKHINGSSLRSMISLMHKSICLSLPFCTVCCVRST